MTQFLLAIFDNFGVINCLLLRVKFNGVDASLTNSSIMLVVSFSLSDNLENAMSSTGTKQLTSGISYLLVYVYFNCFRYP